MIEISCNQLKILMCDDVFEHPFEEYPNDVKRDLNLRFLIVIETVAAVVFETSLHVTWL